MGINRVVPNPSCAPLQYRVAQRGARPQLLEEVEYAMPLERLPEAKQEKAMIMMVEQEIMCCRMLGEVNGRTEFSPSKGIRFDENGKLVL